MQHFIPSIALMLFMFLCLSIIDVRAETGFIKNDAGEYEIWDSTGFYTFKDQIINGKKFAGETILLKNDIPLLENITNLNDLVYVEKFEVFAQPLKINAEASF